MSASEEPFDESVGESETVEADDAEGHAAQIPDSEHPVPLFLRDMSDGQKGNAQDEKDETGE
ncbi:MAG: hypothetical protein ACJ74Q_09125 [Pyrinomonadaceae bacterium]|jgi:hypothetical protein